MSITIDLGSVEAQTIRERPPASEPASNLISGAQTESQPSTRQVGRELFISGTTTLLLSQGIGGFVGFELSPAGAVTAKVPTIESTCENEAQISKPGTKKRRSITAEKRKELDERYDRAVKLLQADREAVKRDKEEFQLWDVTLADGLE